MLAYYRQHASSAAVTPTIQSIAFGVSLSLLTAALSNSLIIIILVILFNYLFNLIIIKVDLFNDLVTLMTLN